jgi:phenylalanyl-tRNA synthetase alpha chain
MSESDIPAILRPMENHDFDSLLARIESAKTIDELAAIEHEIFGRKEGKLTLAMQALKDVSPDEKKKRGAELNTMKQRVTDAIADRRGALGMQSSSVLGTKDVLDVTLPLPKKETGHLHLIPEFIRKAEEVFGRMGFDTAEGPEIESEEFNFNMLNIPDTHPARDAQDTFWMEGEEKKVLRTHTSPVQVRYMLSHKPPFRMICAGKVFRKDADATHSPMFHQIEGLMIGKDVSLANMKAVMETAVKELVSPDVEFRWRSGYFPFVEPGLEMDLRWRGDETQSREGRWLEVVGCGMVHPHVLKNCKIDPEKWQGFAFGFGVERLIMIRHQIPDIRLFYEGDLRFLRQF